MFWLVGGSLPGHKDPKLTRPTPSYSRPLVPTYWLVIMHAINVHELSRMDLMTADLQSLPGRPPQWRQLQRAGQAEQ